MSKLFHSLPAQPSLSLLIFGALLALTCAPAPLSSGRPRSLGNGKAASLPPWQQEISRAPLASWSRAAIQWLSEQGGWGMGRFQIDFSLVVLQADRDTRAYPFSPTEDHFTPDCDEGQVPLPQGGALEGEPGYRCQGDGDCHLLVVARHERRLYEMWRADLRGSTLNGGCLAIWDLRLPYGREGRGPNCTSADAAGLPITPLLFSADEVATGRIDHALRFILPNARIRRQTFVYPATHSTNATRGAPPAPPYGARFRLRKDYPIQHLSKGAQVVARALQKYGMFLADGGNITLTAQSDRFSASKWAGLLGAHDLRALKVEDFEIVEGGPIVPYTGDCRRAR